MAEVLCLHTKKHKLGLKATIRNGQQCGNATFVKSPFNLLFRDVELAPNDLRHPQATIRLRQHCSETVKCLMGDETGQNNGVIKQKEQNKYITYIACYAILQDAWYFRHTH